MIPLMCCGRGTSHSKMRDLESLLLAVRVMFCGGPEGTAKIKMQLRLYITQCFNRHYTVEPLKRGRNN